MAEQEGLELAVYCCHCGAPLKVESLLLPAPERIAQGHGDDRVVRFEPADPRIGVAVQASHVCETETTRSLLTSQPVLLERARRWVIDTATADDISIDEAAERLANLVLIEAVKAP